MKISKKRKAAVELVEKNKVYSLDEALEILEKMPKAKFDESVEVHMKTSIDPKKSDQQVRGAAVLPFGTGKTVRVAAFTDKQQTEAKEAGADLVGGAELIDKIAQSKELKFDVAVATPDMMPKLAKIAKILGPKGLMPNPKSGTVTMDVDKAVKEVKQGKIDFKVDKFGIIHSSIGKVSFAPEQIVDNAQEFINTIVKLKPSSAKGTYIKSVYLSSTMSPGLQIDSKSVSDSN